jgi:hypothetical protein
MTEVLVGGDENIEKRFCREEEITVAEFGPVHFISGLHIVFPEGDDGAGPAFPDRRGSSSLLPHECRDCSIRRQPSCAVHVQERPQLERV